MQHRIVVLGAGYAGASAAGYLARHLHAGDFEITVVNPEPDFVERIRLHQLAAGRQLRRYPLDEMFAGTGIQLRLGRVSAIDLAERTVAIATSTGAARLEYDTLLYTLGSAIADHGIPGVAEFAFDVAGAPAARRLRQRLDQLASGATVLVVGGNLTAIEVATEIAESRPELRVALTTTGELGGWLGPQARRHLLRTFARLGIAVNEHTTIDEVRATAAIATAGSCYLNDVTVWAAGFAAAPIAAASGLHVDADGRMIVDRTMRSVSHPEVFAAGDAVCAIGDEGRALPMSCGTAAFTRMQATAAITAELTGRRIRTTPLSYLGNCVSLGQRDGLFQLVDRDGKAKRWALRGRPAAYLKAAVLRGAAWNMGHPSYGLPIRGRRRATAAGRATETATT